MALFGYRNQHGSRDGLVLISFALFLAGVINERPWKGYTSHQHVEAISEPFRIAVNLLHHGSFADPFGALPTGPTAHSAPGFPISAFLLMELFGEGSVGSLVLRCLPVVALSLQFALLPSLARSLRYSPWVGVLASIFGVITKPGREDRWEAHVAGLLVLLLTCLLCEWMRSHRDRVALAAALVAGVACWYQPVIFLPYMVWVLFMNRASRHRGRALVLFWTVPVLICIPWVIRNRIALDGWFGMRDDLGIELNVSFNDCAPYGFEESLQRGCIQTIRPNSSFDEALAIKNLGEYEYNQDRLRKALAWITDNPARSASLIAQRFFFFWFPSSDGLRGYVEQPKRTLFLHLLTVLSFAGLYLSWKRHLAGALVLTIWLGMFPLIYYVVQFAPRYRYPVLWITWLCAAYAFCAMWERLWPASRARSDTRECANLRALRDHNSSPRSA